MMESGVSRRRLLRHGMASVVGTAIVERGAVAAPGARAADPWRGLKVGVASYTLRKLSVDEATTAIRRVGLSYVSIKDFHLPLDSTAEERRTVSARFREVGISPLSCGVITMQNNEGSVRRAFDYARDAGIPTIVCSPDPASMALLDRMVKEFNLRLAIHNHGPEDKKFPSPYDAWQAVESYDRRIGLCIDVGHTARAGALQGHQQHPAERPDRGGRTRRAGLAGDPPRAAGNQLPPPRELRVREGRRRPPARPRGERGLHEGTIGWAGAAGDTVILHGAGPWNLTPRRSVAGLLGLPHRRHALFKGH
jgi:hypothetical protein